MKKSYMQPAIVVVNLQIESVMAAASEQVSVSGSISSGSADSRSASFDDED